MNLSFFINKKYFVFILITFLLFSCTPRKKQIYFNFGNISSQEHAETIMRSYKLQKGDLLYIKVLTLDEKTFKLFNSEWNNSATRSELSQFLESYSISDAGYIELPIIGKINALNNTIEELQTNIQKQIDNFLMDALVVVKLSNFKITVMGEVVRPGTFKINDNSVNILEAISMAGDLGVYGNRENIKIIRRSEGDKIGTIDITNINAINSEFFYLKPYDLIYVEPTVAKSLGFKEFPFSILFSSITTVIVLINFLNK